MSTFEYHPNPSYGQGVYRRRIKLTGSPGQVLAELEDCNHGFRCTLKHDGEVITHVEAEALRIPMTTCIGAIDPIKTLVGIRIDSSAADINRTVNPRDNCTHLYDLAVLGVVHASRGSVTRVYDVEVDDEVEGVGEGRVYRDGELIHKLKAGQWHIIEPAELKGKPLMKGFSAWANERYEGEEQEAIFVLQKGYFVSQARPYDVDKLAGEPATNHPHMKGVCFTYTSPGLEQAHRTKGTTRDFSDCPEQLLKFL